jgi:cathepsin L
LAEQYLLQCDNASFRCQGGYVNTAISIGLSNGLPLESAYPYNYASNYTDVCTPNVANYKPNVTTNFVGYFSRTIRKDDNGLIAMLLQRPVVLAIAANEVVYYRPTSTERTMRCSSAQSSTPDYLNHAVQLVGYTETEWIIKNSWSTGWGVNGYVYISRAPAENCGIGFYIYSMDAKLPDPAI